MNITIFSKDTQFSELISLYLDEMDIASKCSIDYAKCDFAICDIDSMGPPPKSLQASILTISAYLDSDISRPVDFELLKEVISSFSIGQDNLTHVTEKSENKLHFSPESHKVLYNGITAKLTKNETAIFSLLYDNRGELVTFSTISKQVFGIEDASATIRVHISSIRSKLEKPTGHILITSVPKKGYILK